MDGEIKQGVDGLYAVCFKNNNALSEEKIREMFGTYGNVMSVRFNGIDQKGMVFVRYKKYDETKNCLDGFKKQFNIRVGMAFNKFQNGQNSGGNKFPGQVNNVFGGGVKNYNQNNRRSFQGNAKQNDGQKTNNHPVSANHQSKNKSSPVYCEYLQECFKENDGSKKKGPFNSERMDGHFNHPVSANHQSENKSSPIYCEYLLECFKENDGSKKKGPFNSERMDGHFNHPVSANHQSENKSSPIYCEYLQEYFKENEGSKKKGQQSVKDNGSKDTKPPFKSEQNSELGVKDNEDKISDQNSKQNFKNNDKTKKRSGKFNKFNQNSDDKFNSNQSCNGDADDCPPLAGGDYPPPLIGFRDIPQLAGGVRKVYAKDVVIANIPETTDEGDILCLVRRMELQPLHISPIETTGIKYNLRFCHLYLANDYEAAIAEAELKNRWIAGRRLLVVEVEKLLKNG